MKRRIFLQALAASGLGAGVIGYADTFARALPWVKSGATVAHPIYGMSDEPEWLLDKATGKYRRNPRYILRHTGDLQCHSECGLRVKIDAGTGRIARIIGNPYHANTRDDFLAYDMPLN